MGKKAVMKTRFKLLILALVSILVLVTMMRDKKNPSSIMPKASETIQTAAPTLAPEPMAVVAPSAILNQSESPKLTKKNEITFEPVGGPLSAQEIESVNQIIKNRI